jgi:lysophospholipase L1-like esterase
MLHWVTTSPGSPLVQNPDRVKLITLCYGANDASTKATNATWRFVPLPEYKSNLMQAVGALRSSSSSSSQARRIVLLTPPPAASPPRNDRRLEVTAEYAEAVRQVGRTLKVPVVDLFKEILAVPGWQTQVMLPDGLHLNPAGQQLLFGAVLPTVREALQDV